jgi:serine/threonine-protein kinase HipA
MHPRRPGEFLLPPLPAGKELTLTPAYDICRKAVPVMKRLRLCRITGQNRFSQLKTCLGAAHHFLLSPQAAVDEIDRIESVIDDNWHRVSVEKRSLVRKGKERDKST